MNTVLCKFFRIWVAACCAACLFSCNTDTTITPDTPVELVCVLEYTGSVYSPIRSTAPFYYALYDINGKFISYMDTSRLVAQRIDRLIGKCVVVRGHLVKIDGNSVLRADAIRLKR